MFKKKKTTQKIFSAIPRISFARVISSFILAGLLTTLPEQNLYAFQTVSETTISKTHLIPPTPAPYPVQTISVVPPPEVTAEAVYAVDIDSGVALYEKNSDVRLLPASTTKIMTALVALTEYDLQEIVTVKTVITEGQVMGLIAGETITVENLLYGTLIHSANDAAYALAEHHEQGVTGFVKEMNDLAFFYNLNNTMYVNPIGFDDSNHYTSAKDLARVTQVALKNPTFAKMVSIPQITVSDSTFLHFHPLKNINELLGKIPGVSGAKTGWTENAGQALVTTIQRNHHNVLTVVLKSQDRFKDTENLLNWVFAYFEWKVIEPS